MEAVIEMSALSGRARFTRSALPAAHQLALHVDADELDVYKRQARAYQGTTVHLDRRARRR